MLRYTAIKVICVATVIAAGGLALKDVDVEGHDVFPGYMAERVASFVDGSMPGNMQKESPP